MPLTLADLHLDPANARLHPERNLDSIADSLKRFGQVEALVVQKSTGRVIGGNGRLEVMRSLGCAERQLEFLDRGGLIVARQGWEECDVVELDVDNLEATVLGLALNRTAETATWCDETLGHTGSCRTARRKWTSLGS